MENEGSQSEKEVLDNNSEAIRNLLLNDDGFLEDRDVNEDIYSLERDSDESYYSTEEGEHFLNFNRPVQKDVSDLPKRLPDPRKTPIRYVPLVSEAEKSDVDVLSFWKCLFCDDMLQRIVEHTNAFIQSIKDNFTRPRDACEVDLIEIKAFLGLLYLSGLYHANYLNRVELWNMDEFKEVMSVKRFQFMIRCIRFDDLETQELRKQVDRLCPVREIFEKFVVNCQKCYSLIENIGDDEKSEDFHRCGFVEYIPRKTKNCGVKIYAMMDVRVFYTFNLEAYAGPQPEGPFLVSNRPDDVFKRLVSPIYSSSLKTPSKKKSDVPVLSEFKHKKMSGHTVNRLYESYSVIRSTKHWPLVIFFSMMNIAALNSFIIYSANSRDGMKRRLFLWRLYMSLVEEHIRRRVTQPFGGIQERASRRTNDVPQIEHNTRKRCKPCLQLKRHRLTRYTCQFCGLFICLEHSKQICVDCGTQENYLKRLKNEVRTKEPTKKRCKPCLEVKRSRLTRYRCQFCESFLCLEHSMQICSDSNCF